MKKEKKLSFKASPAWIVAAIFASVALGGTIYYYIDTSDSNERKKKALTAENSKLQKENTALTANYSTPKLLALRKDTDTIKGGMLSSRAANELIRGFGPIWRMSSQRETENSEFITRYYTLTRTSSEVGDWPAILSFFQKLKQRTAFAVTSFTIDSVGENRPRHFSNVTTEIAVCIHKSE
jgi:hypothetical protein